MALSNLIQHPTYVCKQPSTGKDIEYRPFIVKEEKALLLAIQEGTFEAMVANIANLVKSCTFGQLDGSKIPYFDLEYLFVWIRAKSVGEYIELIGGCECDEKAKTEFSVNLSDVSVSNTNLDPLITLSNDIILKMKYPTLAGLKKLKDVDTENDNHVIEALADMIESVVVGDDVYEETTLSEKVDFIENLNKQDEMKISQFLNTLPTVELKTKYTCKHCGTEHDVVLQGLENFFG